MKKWQNWKKASKIYIHNENVCTLPDLQPAAVNIISRQENQAAANQWNIVKISFEF